jgi:hypothetical protein
MSDIRNLFNNPRKRTKVTPVGEIAGSVPCLTTTSQPRKPRVTDDVDDDLPEHAIDVDDDGDCDALAEQVGFSNLLKFKYM